MNYDLARELKDAGFPFKECNHEYPHAVLDFGSDNGPWYDSPSFEQLIEACKNHPVNRKDIGLYTNGGGYVAWARKTYLDDGGDDERDCRGITAVEAVARLWLALNKK